MQTELPYGAAAAPCPEYPQTKTVSLYVPSGDGTRLACDVCFPLDDRGEVPAPLPVILIANRSCRRNADDAEQAIGRALVGYGYIFVSFELRGVGVSYGTNDSFGSREHCQDLMSVLDWVAAQSWCNGKIGLLGCSNRAYIQLCTAQYAPRHVTAITPVVAVGDFYYQNYPNGVSAIPRFPADPAGPPLTKAQFLSCNVPVDEDPEGDLAYAAYLTDQYGKNKNFFTWLLIPNQCRDSVHPNYNARVNLDLPAHGKLAPFMATGVDQHQFIGQFESGTLDQLAQFVEFGGTVCLGPWDHFGACAMRSPAPECGLDAVAVYKSRFDSALKGVRGGLADAPAVHYYMVNAEVGRRWRVAETWPPENECRVRFYLTADGALTPTCPAEAGSVPYQIRTDIVPFPGPDGRSTYSRSALRWDGDMTDSVDRKGLTFTSLPLFPMYRSEMAGCISVDLWLTCTAPDADIIVYAEEVLPDGTSRYIKDGVIRASHRTEGSNPAWEKMGAVWHTSLEADVRARLAEGMAAPVNLRFAIDPIAYHFAPGSRLRITVTGANPAAFQHPMYEAGCPVISLCTGGGRASSISVPFLEPRCNTFTGTVDGAGAALYVFAQKVYLRTGGRWRSWPRPQAFDADAAQVLLGEERIAFRPCGRPSDVPHLPDLAPDLSDPQPFPRRFDLPVATVPVTVHDRLLFVPGSKRLSVDLFHDGAAEKKPCILFIHGYGCAYNYLPRQVARLCRRGYAVAALEMRNYPPNLFPDYLHDAKGCIRYLRAHADALGIDPKRFGVYGFSFGGNAALMLALTGDDPALEGAVGGNLDQSSAVQACVAGFAWSDLLNMGPDIAAEVDYPPAVMARRIAMTDGGDSPSAEVIGFAGPGKGLAVLRAYRDRGCTPPDAAMDAALRMAEFASPIHYVSGKKPPIALFNGRGEAGVNIAFRQTTRMFEALAATDNPVFLYGNNLGEYGEKEEILTSIDTFFDHWLG